MDEIERQVRAWADAAGPAAVEGEPVAAEEVVGPAAPAPSGGTGRRWLAAAAAVLAVAAVGAGVLALTADDAEQVRSGDPTTTAGEPDDEVRFELLHLGLAVPPAGVDDGWIDELPSLRTAASAEQLEELWADVRYLDPTRSSIPPVPEVDVDERVVVSIAIPDDNCPPELRGFRRDEGDGIAGDRLIPQFVETADVCEEPLIPKQYVVALDWASTGDRFSVFVDGGNLSGDPERIPGYGRSSEIRLDRARPARVLVDLELEATTVEAGGSLAGQVVVSNDTGVAIDIGYCGAEFAVGLENDEVDQQLGFDACLQQGQLLPGSSAFDVEISASYGSCVAVGPEDPLPDGMVECLPGGGVPPLPPGEYRTRLYPPGGLEGVDLDVDELAITVTAP